MSFNTFGRLFRVTTWGESHGPALGCTVDGCPPGIPVVEADLQRWLDLRKPGTSKYVTQRREPDRVRILSGVFEGQTTGTPIQLLIENTDQRSKDYGEIKDQFRPGHADYTYFTKYGIRDYRGGGRSSARETAARVAAGGVARAVLAQMLPGMRIRGALVQMGEKRIDRDRWDWDAVGQNPFWCPDPVAAGDWETYLDGIRKDHDSVGAAVEIVAQGVPAGLGAPVYAKLDTDLAAAMMSINAVKGVEIGDGFATAALRGSANADEMRMVEVVEWTVPSAGITEKGVYTEEISRTDGETKRCYLEPHQVELVRENSDGSVTMHLRRNELERRKVESRDLRIVRRVPAFTSNHAGGILGGISSGQDLVVRFAVKPTSSILTPRRSIDRFGKEVEIVTKGRHDPCVGIRAVPVGEAMAACVILDHLLLHRGQIGANRGVLGDGE